MFRPLTRRALRLTNAVVGIATTVMMIGLANQDVPLLDGARDAVHDTYLRSHPRDYDAAGSPVHIIDIDEASLAAYGQWPWPRTYLAVLTEKLYQHGAVAVGFDVLFVEPDRTAGDSTGPVPLPFDTAALPRPATPPDLHDARFAHALATGPSVLGIAGATTGSQPMPLAGVSYTGANPQATLTHFPAALENRAILAEAATGVGLISLGARGDGIVRRVPLISNVGDRLMPALSMELMRVAQGAEGYILRTSQASGETSGGRNQAVALRVGAVELPLEADGQFRVYYSGFRPDRQSPAAQVLQTEGIDADLADRVSGRIVLIGSSAQGLFDIRSTPMNANVPGVTIHAEIIEQVAAGTFLQRPDWALGLEVLVIALTGAILSFALVAERPVLGIATALILAAASIAGSSLAFRLHGLLLDPVMPVLTALLVFLPGASFGFFAKERARAAVRARFSYFLPHDLVDDIADDPETKLTPEGADRELTILFADIRGFTTVTETMAPADVVRYVNRFLACVSDALVASGATIDKFMGDAVMAFWNAPLATPDHRKDAMWATLAIAAAVQETNHSLRAEGLPEIDVAIGVNTGTASVGLMGSSDRLSYTCVGDSVTLASRLEGLTRLYGVGNCVAPATAADVPDGLLATKLDVIAVKGRSEAVPVLTISHDTPESRQAAEAIARARAAFIARDWPAAEAAFAGLSDKTLGQHALGQLAQTYLDRISELKGTALPADWDGSMRAQSKR